MTPAVWPVRKNFRFGIFVAAIMVAALMTCSAAWGQAARRGEVRVAVLDILDQPLNARVEMQPQFFGPQVSRDFPEGTGSERVNAGAYTCRIYVRTEMGPILVDVQEIEVPQDGTAELSVRLLEGASGVTPLHQFDSDYDGVLDSLEIRMGTDPADARSVPGLTPYTWPSPVLDAKGGWYKGDLHVHSTHGRGGWTVAAAVREAERLGLDFLAITDRNKLDAAFDPDFKSSRVVLLPALEWGDEARGIGIVIAPASLPPVPHLTEDARGLAVRVQAQGGIFIAGQPCFPTNPWQWPIDYVNGIQVWSREYRKVPPISLAQLNPELREQVQVGETKRFRYPIAYAANTEGMSANGQAGIFWDLQMLRGVRAAAIAGSSSASPKVPMARPMTYIYAREKSLEGILDGLRRGWTYVTSGPDGPQIDFQADIGSTGDIDVGIGGVIPVNMVSRFIVGFQNAKGLRFEVLLNGHPIRSGNIPVNDFTYNFEDEPIRFGVYRVRVITAAKEPAFGLANILAMTSAIYAHGVLANESEPSLTGWVDIQSEYVDPSTYEGLLPRNAEQYEIPVSGRIR